MTFSVGSGVTLGSRRVQAAARPWHSWVAEPAWRAPGMEIMGQEGGVRGEEEEDTVVIRDHYMIISSSFDVIRPDLP